MSDGAIIALIPAGATGEVHLTLVYFSSGLMSTMRTITSALAAFQQPFTAVVMDHDTFGTGTIDNPYVKVAKVESPALRVLNEVVQDYSISEFGFAPHISAQPGYTLPTVGSMVTFDRVGVWNDDDRTAWRLGTGARCAV